jgi:hypothetical protein
MNYVYAGYLISVVVLGAYGALLMIRRRRLRKQRGAS